MKEKKTLVVLASTAAMGLGICAADAAPITLQNTAATFEQGGFAAANTIDGNTATGGWAVDPFRNGNHVLVYETATDLIGVGTLSVDLINNFGDHTIEHFRVSVTDANRSTFADGTTPGDVTAPWTLLDLDTLSSLNGSVLTEQAGHDVIVSNPQSTDTFTVTAQNPLATITGVRVEVKVGTQGTTGQTAAAASNNSVLTEVQADFTSGGTAGSGLTSVALTNPTATFAQASLPVSETIDSQSHGDNGWGVDGQTNTDQTAIYETAAPITASALLLELDFTSQFANHTMRKFRLAYTTDVSPSLGGTWTVIDPDTVTTVESDSSAAEQVDIYQFYATDLFSGVTGFRVEALTDGGFVGFSAGNNNFVLTEFSVYAETIIPEPASFALLTLGLPLMLMRDRKNTHTHSIS